MKQIKLSIEIPMRKRKKPSIAHRLLVANAEVKSLMREEQRMIKNRRRYYLHHMCRKHGLEVMATKYEVIISDQLTERQAYYVNCLLAMGYNIQKVIS